MNLIDTHCHLYSDEFGSDIAAVMQRAGQAGVSRFFLPAIDSKSIPAVLMLEQRFPACKAMMGLHPCSVKEDYRSELEVVGDWLSKRSFIGVGEIGLDYYWDKTFIREQAEAFKTQLNWSVKYGLPVSIHARDAMGDAIALVKEFADQGARGVFHCFGGTEQEARAIIDMGFYLGIGGVVTFKKAGLAETLQNIDLQYVVLETDAPYLAPMPFRGKRNESSHLSHIVAKLAEVKNCTPEEVAAVTSANAEKIFGL